MDEIQSLYFRHKKPRKIREIKPSKYESAGAIQCNKTYWNSIFNEVDPTHKTALDESRYLAEVLPRDRYTEVCAILNLPVTTDLAEDKATSQVKLPRRLIKGPMVSTRKSLYINREMDSDTDVEASSSDGEGDPNIHKELLMKPEREQVTWATHYLQPEREEEKSLVKKADDLTDRIAQEFCEYMKQLGGDEQSQLFNPKAIKELFQIEFDTHVARSLRVMIKELPTVDEKIANVTNNPEKSRYAALEREVSKDIEAERRGDHNRAFGRSVPLREQYRAPNNNTKQLWRSARHVPNDLVTLKTVWEGITNLRSVEEYCRWMIEHPEYRRAPYLSSLGMFDPAVLNARVACEPKQRSTVAAPGHSFTDTTTPIENIRKRLSHLVDQP